MSDVCDQNADRPLLRVAQAEGVSVEYDIETATYRLHVVGRGIFPVTEEAVREVEAILGPEYGWEYIRTHLPHDPSLPVSWTDIDAWRRPQAMT